MTSAAPPVETEQSLALKHVMTAVKMTAEGATLTALGRSPAGPAQEVTRSLQLSARPTATIACYLATSNARMETTATMMAVTQAA